MSDLRKKASSGVLWQLAGSYGGQLISFVISIFLARLLSPEEFGIVGMSMVFLVILEVFKNFGFSSALIQQKKPNALAYSSVFYVNIVIGILLTIVIYFLAPLVANFYRNDEVENVLRLLSITFFLSSFNIVQTAILNKQFDFKFLITRRVIAQVSGGVLAIIFAFNGFGVFALVIQQITSSVVGTFLLWRISSWRPDLKFSWVEVQKLLNFSGFVFLSQLFSNIVREVETLLFGKLFSAAFLGFYSRANSLNKLIYNHSVNSLSKVLLPTLSEVQDENERFNSIYIKLVNIVSVISLALTGVFYFSGESIIIVLFGAKWEPSIALFKIIILKGFTLPISMIIVNTLLAKGFSKQVFFVGRLREVLYISVMPLAFYYNAEVYLYASVVVSVVAWLINNMFVSKYLKIKFLKQLMVVLPNLVITATSVLLINFLRTTINMNFLIQDLLSVFLFLLIFISWLYFSKSVVLNESKLLLRIISNKIK